MKTFKKLMATFFVLTLVLGATMTTFAAEESVTEMGTKNIDINMEYSRTEAEEAGKDDTKENLYNIKIEYDALNFSYVADSIKWDPATSDYKVTLKEDTNTAKGIKVTNQSNRIVKMTPSLNDSGITKKEGVLYSITLLRNGNPLWGMNEMSSAHMTADSLDIPSTLPSGEADELTVKATGVGFTSDVENFNEKFAAVSLSFEDAMDLDENDYEDPF